MTAKELASYYRAAVEYIDPHLAEDCPIEDICAAAKARQRALTAHDSETARLELEKIEEALQFIRRVHPEIVCELSEEAGPQVAADPGKMDAPVELVAPEPMSAIVAEDIGTERSQQVIASMSAGNPSADDEIVELVIAAAAPAEPVAEATLEEVTEASGELEHAPLLAEALPVEADTEVELGGLIESMDQAVELEQSEIAVSLQALEADSPESETTNAEADAAELDLTAASESVQDAQAALAEAMIPAPQAEPAADRRQFIAELQERRRNGYNALDEDEASELIAELRTEQHSEERAQQIIERVPAVEERLEQELQREERGQRQLDFRSMMQRAGADPQLKVKPASRPRLSTDEILSRPRPERRTPEEHAAPIILGMLLIIWQFSAALLAGFALCRLSIWHFGTAFSSLTPLKMLLAFLVLLGTAALVGAGFRYYRLRSHKLSLPVHVSAGSVLLILVSWQLAAKANAYASAPPAWLWCLLLACWLVAAIAAGLHDVRVPPPGNSDEDSGLVAAKPVAPGVG
ncbi:hypothetical protein KDL44_10545 [bacterium]|nr:hypothetical protein [bacterium]